MGTENQLVKVEHLYKEFDAETKVLSDINLTINKNEVIAILGPSGTGKSTLLRCLNYLTVPTKGKITMDECLRSSITSFFVLCSASTVTSPMVIFPFVGTVR